MQVGDGLKDSLLFEGGGREGGRELREEDEWEVIVIISLSLYPH